MRLSPIRDFLVGLFVLAGIGAIAYLSISIGDISWRGPTGFKLWAAFDETGGLSLRAPVVIAGVRVGDVSSITLQDDFRAKITMDLDPSLKLPTDTSASIVTAGILGDRYIELQPGGDDTLLKSGDQINFTESAMILERLIAQLIYGKTNAGSAHATTAPATAP
jgi:phospholipid/cholesterol/gamma-HCH transport system substrate-binding protein